MPRLMGELILHQISNLVSRGDIHVSLLYRDCIFTGTGPGTEYYKVPIGSRAVPCGGNISPEN